MNSSDLQYLRGDGDSRLVLVFEVHLHELSFFSEKETFEHFGNFNSDSSVSLQTLLDDSWMVLGLFVMI